MRDWTTLLTNEEKLFIQSNFNSLIEDIINQSRIVNIKQAIDTVLTQITALPIDQQLSKIQAIGNIKV